MDGDTKSQELAAVAMRIEPGRRVPVGGVLTPAGALRRCHLLEFPRWRGGSTIRVRVRGDALAADGVRDGDYLVLDQRMRSLRPGQTVLANIGGCTVVRRISATVPGKITLAPTRTMLPLLPVAGAQRIHGAVVGIMRKQGFEHLAGAAPVRTTEPLGRRLRSLEGSLRSLRATYRTTRHPRLRRALHDEAIVLRRELDREQARLGGVATMN
jgi:hypothetical protein